MKKIFAWCCRNKFILLLIISTVSGYVLGISLQSSNLSSQTLQLISFPGKLILRAFMMIIVPLLFCSLVLGVTSVQNENNSRMVILTIGFFLFLLILSVIMGVAAGHLVHPGQKITNKVSNQNKEISERKNLILDSFLDLVWNAVPSNIIESTFTKEYTHVEILNDTLEDPDAATNLSVSYKKTIKQARGVNFIGLLIFSLLFGVALASMGEKGRQLREVIQQLNDVVRTILGYILKFLSIGMFFWMLREGLEPRDQYKVFSYIGLFLLTAFGCMILHQFVLLPLLYLRIVRKNPFRFHLNLIPAMLTAFGTSSSAATLPLTIQCVEESNHINSCITRFVLPLGMVVHMDGSTLYNPLGAIFLAQLEGVEIGIAETSVMCITAIILMISAPGIPLHGEPINILTILAAGGVNNPQFISIYLSIDWFMERFCTVMNVVGDCYVAAFVDKLCSNKKLSSQDKDMPADEGYVLNTINQKEEER